VEKRSRLLPAHVVVYFVLALSLFTDGRVWLRSRPESAAPNR
jgi:hypothetical protein